MSDSPELPEENEASFSDNTFGHKLLNWVLIFIIRLQAKNYLPDATILSILKFIAAVLSLRQTKWLTSFHLQKTHYLSILN